MNIELKLKKPLYPNFIKLEAAGGNEVILAIQALDDEQLESVAEQWKAGLIDHAKRKRELAKLCQQGGRRP